MPEQILVGQSWVPRDVRAARRYERVHGGPMRFVLVGEVEGRAVLRVFTGSVATLRRRFVPLAELGQRFIPEG